MTNNIPYLRNNIPTLLTLSTISLLLLASPLLLSSFLLQPAQAQTPMTIRTPTPADGSTVFYGQPATIAFGVHGTVLNAHHMDITNGSFQITSKQDGKILYNGSISSVWSCCLTNLTGGGEKFSLDSPTQDDTITITTRCSTSATNSIAVYYLSGGDIGHFQGSVECSPQGGNATTPTQQLSSAFNRMGG